MSHLLELRRPPPIDRAPARSVHGPVYGSVRGHGVMTPQPLDHSPVGLYTTPSQSPTRPHRKNLGAVVQFVDASRVQVRRALDRQPSVAVRVEPPHDSIPAGAVVAARMDDPPGPRDAQLPPARSSCHQPPLSPRAISAALRRPNGRDEGAVFLREPDVGRRFRRLIRAWPPIFGRPHRLARLGAVRGRARAEAGSRAPANRPAANRWGRFFTNL